MIIIYVSFEFDGDPAEFDAWFIPLVEETRASPGCTAYEYLVDPVRASRRYMFEVWESEAAATHHSGAPAHVEMLALGTAQFGMRDLRIERWDNPAVHKHSVRARTDEHVDGREHVDDLIAAIQREHFGRVLAVASTNQNEDQP